jgi:hypothetical protein
LEQAILSATIAEFSSKELHEIRGRSHQQSFISSFMFDSIVEHPEEEFESYRKTTSTTGSTPLNPEVKISDLGNQPDFARNFPAGKRSLFTITLK